jgi:thrombospondin type 3 repeat protein
MKPGLAWALGIAAGLSAACGHVAPATTPTPVEGVSGAGAAEEGGAQNRHPAAAAPRQPIATVTELADRDGDWVPDRDDKCPTEPEDRDGFEDADGCPELDNDRDGIPDTQDRCPNHAEDKDGFEDEDGCPDDGGRPR